jgi:hypothetical protein
MKTNGFLYYMWMEDLSTTTSGDTVDGIMAALVNNRETQGLLDFLWKRLFPAITVRDAANLRDRWNGHGRF